MKRLFISALYVLLVLSISVSAQSSGMDLSGLLKTLPNVSSQVLNGMFSDLVKKDSANKNQIDNVETKNQSAALNNQAAASVKVPDNKIGSSRTTFTPTGSSSMHKEFAKGVIKNEEDRKKFEQILIKNYGDYETIIKNSGWAGNDVARSASSLLVTCINFYRNDGNLLTEAQRAGIYRQIKKELETDPEFQAATNMEKQKAHEINVNLRTLLLIFYDIGKENNDQKIIKGVGDIGAMIFELYTGKSIEKVKVTDSGMKL